MTRAYHFVGDTLRDGRPIPPDGEWLVHDGPCVMCESGLHASEHPYDALQYAPGGTLCLVECEDEQERQDDKLLCRRRKIIARFDATDLLRTFARMCALDVLHLWDAPAVVVYYLITGEEEFRAAAWAAAWDATATGDAAGAARAATATGDAAGAARAATATGDAAGAARAATATGDAAGAARAATATGDAAGAARAATATGDAAWVATRDAARAAARDAAATGDAAWVAADVAQKIEFKRLVDAKFADMGHA